MWGGGGVGRGGGGKGRGGGGKGRGGGGKGREKWMWMLWLGVVVEWKRG